MPVTFKVAPHDSSPIKQFSSVASAEAYLRASASKESKLCAEVLQHSVVPGDLPHAVPDRNGFVHACVRAYNEHQHLVIRPDDIWLCILSQFSLYVNAHAEEMRSYFVSHEGKKDLTVHAVGTRYTVDFGSLARQMTDLLDENILDKELKTWIMNDFSTTTTTDTVCAAILMMGTMQKYFDYGFCLECGLPSVTLLGEKEDYEKILGRLSKLSNFGGRPALAQWQAMLTPILRNMVKSFDCTGPVATGEILTFWQTICHYQEMFSGDDFLSGWITAFCAISKDGELTLRSSEHPAESERRYLEAWKVAPPGNPTLRIPYASISIGEIPNGYCAVPVKLNDNDELFDTTMVAGLLGYNVTESQPGKKDTIAPYPAWFMFILDDELVRAEEAMENLFKSFKRGDKK